MLKVAIKHLSCISQILFEKYKTSCAKAAEPNLYFKKHVSFSRTGSISSQLSERQVIHSLGQTSTAQNQNHQSEPAGMSEMELSIMLMHTQQAALLFSFILSLSQAPQPPLWGGRGGTWKLMECSFKQSGVTICTWLYLNIPMIQSF